MAIGAWVSYGHAVVVVVETQSVPVHGRLGVGVVANADRDLRSLTHAQRRAGDRPVVGEHADAVVAELLDDRRDAQVEGVAVGELDDGGPGRSRRGRSTSVEKVAVMSVVVVGGVVHDASAGAGRSGRRSSGTGIG